MINPITGASTMNITILLTPQKWIPDIPAFSNAGPISPPIKACETLLVNHFFHRNRPTIIAASKAARIK